MLKHLCSWIASVFLLNMALPAQCPEQGTLFNRLLYIRDSSKLSAKEKLAELHGYLSTMKNCPYRNDSTHLALLNLIGGIYFQQADFARAAEYRLQAISLINVNARKPFVKLTSLPGIYYWLSVTYDSLNNFSDKMKALDSCSAIAMRLNYVDRSSLAAIYARLVYFFDIGDYNRCIDYAAKCQSLARQYAQYNSITEQRVAESYISSSFGWQVIALLKLKKFTEAERLLANKITEYKKAGLTNYLGTTYSQLAEVQLNKRDYDKAILYYNKAYQWDKKAGFIFNCKQTLKDIGYVYFFALNDKNKARFFYRRALRLTNLDKGLTEEDAFESLDIFARIAEINAQEKKYDSAFYYYRLALHQVSQGSDENTIVTTSTDERIRLKKIYYITRLLLDKADVHIRQYKDSKQTASIKQAITTLKLTDQLLDRIRAEQKDPRSKLFWRNDSRRLYENAIEACYLYGNQNEAFYFFEKSRAVLLSDQLNEQRWQRQQVISQQTQLKKKILQLERQISVFDPSSTQYDLLQAQLFDYKQSLDRLEQTNILNIRSNNQNYFITPAYVQKYVLNDHRAFIELFEGDSAVYILCITAKVIQFKKIDKHRFDSLSTSFIMQLSNTSLLNKSFTGFTKTSRDLCQLLFENIQLPNGRIIISPDATSFPFEALITSGPGQPLSYFVNDHAVSYTYSARYLANDFSNTSTSQPMFLGIAPVQYVASLNLPALPGSVQSLIQMENDFDSPRYLMAEKATRSNFLQQFFRYTIVQLYTHSSVNSLNGEPAIYFRDSVLLLSDLIYENKPATKLIVLSACETGTGKLNKGEGIFSFNRGFAAIGIPSSVSSLWKVENESTYRLTELFYKWLAKELPLDVALQKAKIEFWNTSDKEKKLPYYWAAPILAGQSGAIKIEKTSPWKILIIAFASALFLLGGWRLYHYIHKKQKEHPPAEFHDRHNTTF